MSFFPMERQFFTGTSFFLTFSFDSNPFSNANFDVNVKDVECFASPSEPNIEINPETYEVKVDGKLATVNPADKLSLARLYNLY